MLGDVAVRLHQAVDHFGFLDDLPGSAFLVDVEHDLDLVMVGDVVDDDGGQLLDLVAFRGSPAALAFDQPRTRIVGVWPVERHSKCHSPAESPSQSQISAVKTGRRMQPNGWEVRLLRRSA